MSSLAKQKQEKQMNGYLLSFGVCAAAAFFIFLPFLVVDELHAHFSEKKTLALLYKLERATRELAAVGQQVVSLSEEFKQRW